MAVVCDYSGLNSAMLEGPSRQSHIARARGVISRIAFDALRLRGVDIAQQLNLTLPAVSKLVAKGRAGLSAEEIERILYEKR